MALTTLPIIWNREVLSILFSMSSDCDKANVSRIMKFVLHCHL